MFVAVTFVEARPEHVASLRAALLLLTRHSLEHEPKCLRHDVSAHPLEPTGFLVYEVYEDEAAHRAHQDAEHVQWFEQSSGAWVATKRMLTYELISDAGQA